MSPETHPFYDLSGRVAVVTGGGGDCADDAVVQRMAREALGAFGHVDVLVNVAGRGEPRWFWELERPDFDRVLADNLGSAWSWAHALMDGMRAAGWGRIVNIASISAKHGGGPPATVSKSAYAASKAGVLGLTRGLAKELAPEITVNAICPGLIQTRGTRSLTKGRRSRPSCRRSPSSASASRTTSRRLSSSSPRPAPTGSQASVWTSTAASTSIELGWLPGVPGRAARRARPRCDAGDHHAWTLTRIARNPELVVARKEAEGCVDCANTYRELARSTRRGVLARAGGLAVAGLGLSLLDVGSIARGLRGESGRRSVPTEPGRAVF